MPWKLPSGRLVISVAALVALLAPVPSHAEDVRCGACSSTPEEIVAKYGPPGNDALAGCGLASDKPTDECRRLTYFSDFPKETHRLYFVKRDNRWGLSLCEKASKNPRFPELVRPCRKSGE